MVQGNFCPNCGAARKQGALFCSSCGTKYPDTAGPSPQQGVVCKACGNPIKQGDKFCSKCLVKVPDAGAVQPAPAAKPPAAPAPAAGTGPAAAAGVVCKSCGNPIKPGEKFCSKCLVKVPDEVQAAVAAAKTATSAPKPLAKVNASAIPSVECWQVAVTRVAGAEKKTSQNPMTVTEVTELVADSGIQVHPVPPSPDLLAYPRISDTTVEGRSWGIGGLPVQSFTQTEQMTVILDAASRTMYCVFAPEVEYVPPVRGVTKFAFSIGDRMQVMPQGIPKVWSRFSEGDYITNYPHLPVLIGRDYASFFTVVPVTAAGPEKKTGLLAFAGDLQKGLKDTQYVQWEGQRNPADRITPLAQVRPTLLPLLSSPAATTALAYRQRVCAACGSALIFDPDENALFCSGCGAYTTRYGVSPREARYLDYLIKCEKAANRAPDANLLMMRRAAFCPRCSTWLKYVFIPQTQQYGTPGNHLWYCPHCVTECTEIMDRPLNRPHQVVCSHCGSTDSSLQRAGTTVCPSCGSQFMTAPWEALPPMPESDPNEVPWGSMTLGPYSLYRLAGQG